MTDSSGAVIWSADYKPFGEATVTVSTITNNLRFPGQYYDAETGLNYNYMRDYNPVIGRYIESDPIGIKKGKNHLYVYVANNSLKSTDPFGLKETCTWAGFSGTVVLGVGVSIIRDAGICVDDCGKTKVKNRTCACACVGLGASVGGQVQSGDSSSNPQGWGISTPYVSFSFDGATLTGGGTGPGAGLFYCWCNCTFQ